MVDPIGALILYLAVVEAIKSGDLIVPSSQRISDLLHRGADPEHEQLPDDPPVELLWADLSWLNESRLLFNEHQYSKTEYFRTLSQHNVNERLRHFSKGFVQRSRRERQLVPTEFVERASTAARLVGLKDLYFFNRRELPYGQLEAFLTSERLIADKEQCPGFVKTMVEIGYVHAYPTAEWAQYLDQGRPVELEPTSTFRHYDQYLELRALDHFNENLRLTEERRKTRLELHEAAKRFVEHTKQGS